MKILITGGAGFIGSNVADEYMKLGHQVVVVDDLSSGKKEYVSPNAAFYETDIRNKEKMEEIISREKPDVINHHAAQMSVRKSVEDPVNDATINIIGLLNILESSRTHGVKKVIFASSGGVAYGDASIIPTPESYAPLLPLSPYGVTKLASEYYLHFYHKTYGISYVALRYGNVYGPRQNPHGEAGVVAIFAKKLLAGEAPVINGDGLQTRDYVFVGDVVAANVASLTPSTKGSYNVGTGKETNVVEIFQNIQKAVETQIEASHGPAKPGEQKRSCLDCALAQKELGWSPKVPLVEGLKKTVEFFRNAA